MADYLLNLRCINGDHDLGQSEVVGVPQMKFVTIDDPNADQDPNFFDGTSVEAINNSGVVVGEYGNSGNQYGFYDFLGNYTTLFPPGAVGNIAATAINDVGQIAGYYDWGPGILGFIYSGGVYTNVQAPGASTTYIRAINNAGVMVGYYGDSQGVGIHGFRATSPNKNDFTEINVPSAKYTIAFGINNAGDIVGWFADSNSSFHGFIDHNGTFTVLDDPLATKGTRLTSINDQGQIVGSYSDDTSSHVFLYSGGVFTTVTNINGGKDFGIGSINDRGMIAGSYSDPAGNHGFVGVPTIQPDNFNGDNFSDMLWRSANGALIDWTMNGATIAGSGSVTLQGNAVAPDASWKIAGTSDFNNDGKTDVLWRQDSGSLALWLMNGSTITSSNAVAYQGNPITPDASWSVAGTADFNGDGNADLLWRQNSGALALWIMNGASATSSSPLTYQGQALMPDASWSIAGVGDFDSDGSADLLWRQNSGALAIWDINGATVASSSTVTWQGNAIAPDPSWSVAGIGDFNRDGNADILWRQSSGALAIWQMNGSAVQSSAPITYQGNVIAPDASWKMVEIGDFNGDGNSDILWRNDNGSMSEWLMNGSQIMQSLTPSSQGNPAAPDSSWTVQAKPTNFG